MAHHPTGQACPMSNQFEALDLHSCVLVESMVCHQCVSRKAALGRARPMVLQVLSAHCQHLSSRRVFLIAMDCSAVRDTGSIQLSACADLHQWGVRGRQRYLDGYAPERRAGASAGRGHQQESVMTNECFSVAIDCAKIPRQW